MQKTKAYLIFLPTEVYTYKAFAESHVTSDQLMSVAGYSTKNAERILYLYHNLLFTGVNKRLAFLLNPAYVVTYCGNEITSILQNRCCGKNLDLH